MLFRDNFIRSVHLLSVCFCLLLLLAEHVSAGGECTKCTKIWDQPWAREFKVCPACAGKLVPFTAQPQRRPVDRTGGLEIRRVKRRFRQYYHRRAALCIGINDYSRTGFGNLECAVKDAEDMAGVFSSYAFEDITLLTDVDARKRKIVNELLRIKAESHDDDLLVVYFAGHGSTVPLQDGGEMGYLIAVDSKAGKEEETAISMGIIKDIADTNPAKHQLFLMDCCYSGYGLARGMSSIPVEAQRDDLDMYLRTMTSARAVQIITAGTKGEQAGERAGHGAFTMGLLDELLGRTESGSDGAVSALEMAAAVKRAVTIETEGRQNPQFGYLYGTGDVVFVTGRQKRRSASVVTDETPEQVRKRVAREYKGVLRLEEAGKFAEAERIMNRIYRQSLRADTLDRETQLTYLETLDDLLLEMYKGDLAIHYAKELADIADTEAHQALADSNLGHAYVLKSEYGRAIEHQNRSLATRLKVLGPDHPDVAESFFRLGWA
ncbi:MAG: tetratricopeptide repeat protein, partial [Lentisphaerae bacterium]|nr:tetratricopeptide repeat protein [Lentisphaerota bacterium]